MRSFRFSCSQKRNLKTKITRIVIGFLFGFTDINLEIIVD